MTLMIVLWYSQLEHDVVYDRKETATNFTRYLAQPFASFYCICKASKELRFSFILDLSHYTHTVGKCNAQIGEMCLQEYK